LKENEEIDTQELLKKALKEIRKQDVRRQI